MRQGERESSKLTDVICKRRGCRNRLTVIALQQSPAISATAPANARDSGARPGERACRAISPVEHDADL
jgi:hypothetical protein